MREEQKIAAVEQVGAMILGRDCVSYVYRQAVGAEYENAQLSGMAKVARLNQMVAAKGLEPPKGQSAPSDTSATQAGQTPAISGHSNELQVSDSESSGQNSDKFGHQSDTSEHKKCATYVQWQKGMPEDLRQVVQAWDQLSAEVKRQILALTAEAKS